jgi:hypothetical protein
LHVVVCCPQFLCYELAKLHLSGQLSCFKLVNVAHIDWRMQVALELQDAMEAYEKVRDPRVHTCGQQHRSVLHINMSCLRLAALLLAVLQAVSRSNTLQALTLHPNSCARLPAETGLDGRGWVQPRGDAECCAAHPGCSTGRAH